MLLWLCAVFSAVQTSLGAWVVSSIGDAPAVQICTPQGLQWVSLSPDAPPDEHQASALLPCIWAGAHVAISQPVVTGVTAAVPASPAVPDPGPGLAIPSDLASRVLLMSAMRAPPLRA